MPSISSPEWKAKRRTKVVEDLKLWTSIAGERCTRCRMGLYCPGLVAAQGRVKDLQEELHELGPT